MFNSLEGNPLILRLYGTAKTIHPDEIEWNDLIKHFPVYTGKRQIVDMKVETEQTSCGFGVPLYEFKGERDELIQWAEKKGEAGIREYQTEKNAFSMDGKKIR